MLHWPAGRRDSDGVWGEHWYANVWKSTGFARQTPNTAALSDTLNSVLDQALPAYEAMLAHRLLPAAITRS